MNNAIKNLRDWKVLVLKAESGDAKSQLEVAYFYDSGVSVKGRHIVLANPAASYEWTKRAFDSGSVEAMERYANYLSDGVYCKQDKRRAMELYEKAMKAGSLTAAHNLGVEYRDKQDFEKAFSLYKKDKTNFSVGMCYYYGVGVAQNRLLAFRFFKKMLKADSFQSGYEINEANYMVGKMYLEGEVVKRSISKARHHLLLAAEDGDHRSAQQILWLIGRK
ncbi:MAG: sel1 repeat family protein [Taibaiella sp.]|nr:sel1 repeat family protein [Taibaiella sp.]